MQSQFTDKATTALQLAATEAKAQKQHYIGTEHILIGLLEEGTGVAASVQSRCDSGSIAGNDPRAAGS